MRGLMLDRFALKPNDTTSDRLNARDGMHQCRFSGTIGPDQSNNLAFVDMERHPMQDFYAPVRAFDILN